MAKSIGTILKLVAEKNRQAAATVPGADLPTQQFTARMARTHRKVVVMDDLNTRRLRFDVEPWELVRLLRGYSKVKAGPFSWRTPSGKGEIGLYLDVRKSNRDGFECKVNTIRYRKPGGSFLAEEGLHVITLEGSRVRDGETLVLMRCHEPKARDSVFVHFYVEMDRLRQELAKPVATEDGASHGLAVSRAAERKEESMPAAEEANVEDSVTAKDDRLDAVDRNLIKVVERLERAGLRPTDELVASKMHPNPRTELSYNRVTINRRRGKLRDKGYNV
jgi:hypothetical protein